MGREAERRNATQLSAFEVNSYKPNTHANNARGRPRPADQAHARLLSRLIQLLGFFFSIVIHVRQITCLFFCGLDSTFIKLEIIQKICVRDRGQCRSSALLNSLFSTEVKVESK